MGLNTGPDREPRRQALRISSLYLVIGALWILGSDVLTELLAGETSRISVFQHVKGLAFVLVTAAGLFYLIYHTLRDLRRSQHENLRDHHKQAELTSYLNAIIDAAPAAIFDLDENGTVQRLWNPMAERLFGFPADAVVGTRPHIIAEKDWQQIAASRSRVLDGETVPLLEVELLRKDGSTFPAVVAAAPVMAGGKRTTVVIVSDLTERRETVQRLRTALEEREVLLREIHHRVKNNLQIISSLLVLERHGLEPGSGEHAGLSRALSRVRTIGRIHEQLYRSADFANVDLAAYVRTLSGDISTAYDPQSRIQIDLDLDPLWVDIDQAIPIGLILHELLVNVYQHAFPDGTAGVVRVVLNQEEDTAELVVEDNGVGIAAERRWTASSLGLTLVEALAAQIDGRLTTDGGVGTTVSVRAALTPRPESK